MKGNCNRSCLSLRIRKPIVTHAVFAALHINVRMEDETPEPSTVDSEKPSTPEPRKRRVLHLTLNDNDPDDPYYDEVWKEKAALQAKGVKTLLLIGGAAHGTISELDYAPGSFEHNQERFEVAYGLVRDLLIRKNFDDLDLDVEEPMTQSGAERFIRRIRQDFSKSFLVTMSPMAPGLQGGRELSLLDYSNLEQTCGDMINWYHVQFYNGWGSAGDAEGYEKLVETGFDPSRLVLAILSSSGSWTRLCGNGGSQRSFRNDQERSSSVRGSCLLGILCKWEEGERGGSFGETLV
ncbi:hypothetical protein QFC20_001330 [Naganishia adeliensis]|uniref:Uncharacterized protein n=1 Tax=Naganishia adeliensis TaxID=92952 RepID=A0ACC2WT65_9TREE|nr:hypothetical protein QFC20_001330 [Naganishia adeliensis]